MRKSEFKQSWLSPSLIRPGIEPRQSQGPAGRPGVNEEVSAESPLHRDGPCTLNPPPVVSLSLGEPAPSWWAREAALPPRTPPPRLQLSCEAFAATSPALSDHRASLRCFLLLPPVCLPSFSSLPLAFQSLPQYYSAVWHEGWNWCRLSVWGEGLDSDLRTQTIQFQ